MTVGCVSKEDDTINENTSIYDMCQEITKESGNLFTFQCDETSKNKLEGSIEVEENYEIYFTEDDIVNLAKLLLRECGGVKSKTEQACVAWCVLNRVDKYSDTIYNIISEAGQFAFDESAEVRDDLYELAEDVLIRWNSEKNGVKDSGRVLPTDYLYFYGDGIHNYFRSDFNGDYDIWDYSLDSPYEN